MMFFVVAAVLAVLAIAIATWPLWRHGRRFEGTLAAVFVAGTALGIYLLIGRPDLALEPPQALDVSQPQDVLAMVEKLAERLEAQPEDAEGWTMLGRAYVLMGRYQEAANAFGRAISQTSGENPDLVASLAEARALGNPASLEGEAGALFERVLELDPDNPRALWYGGLQAQARGDDAVALARWQRLLGQDLPPEFREVLEGRIASIDPTRVGALVSVKVSLDPSLANAAPPNAVLFVFLRPVGEGEQGPPLAARRLEFFDLPETLPLTARNLLRGENLPEGAFTVTARLSADGDPAAGEGDLEGRAEWNPEESSTVDLVLDTRAGE